MSKCAKKRQRVPEYFHHSMPLEFVSYSEITAHPDWGLKRVQGYPDRHEEDDITICESNAHKWLGEQIGFYPFFTAVGNTTYEIHDTGYAGQWRRVLRSSKDFTEYRKAGEFPNSVLFSWKNLESGVFADFDTWFIPLNNALNPHRYPSPAPKDHELRSLFKKSWSRSKWLRASTAHYRKGGRGVIFLTPTLDLRTAKVRCRNKQTEKMLRTMGFENVEVFRLQVPW